MDTMKSFPNAPAGHPASNSDPASAAQATMPAGATRCEPRIRKYLIVAADYANKDLRSLIEVICTHEITEAQVGAIVSGFSPEDLSALDRPRFAQLFELIGRGVAAATAWEEIASLPPGGLH